MSRKLDSLINKYGDVKSKLADLKKEESNLNQTIKSLMVADDLKEVSTDTYKVVYQERTSESLDEDKVIDILKKNNVKGIVKTKQYVDEDALEQAIYNGKLDADIIKQISNAKITKTTVALMVKGV